MPFISGIWEIFESVSNASNIGCIKMTHSLNYNSFELEFHSVSVCLLFCLYNWSFQVETCRGPDRPAWMDHILG